MLESLPRVAAVLFLASGIYPGASALTSHNEAIKAEATATIYEDQGNPQAAEWQAYADAKEGDRNGSLAITGVFLGVAAINGYAGFISLVANRRRKQESES